MSENIFDPMLNTSSQKKSAIFTFVFMVMVVLLMFFCGLSYVDPPEEYGVAINFGSSEVGSGTPVQNKISKSRTDVVKSEQTLQSKSRDVAKEIVKEEMIQSKEAEAPEIVQTPKSQSPKKTVQKKEVEKEVLKPDEATQNALNNLFKSKKSVSDEEVVSEGDDIAKTGMKGKETGVKDLRKYDGTGGLGDLGNYSLSGRKVKSKPKKKPNCNEEGIVVVRVEVDAFGKVIDAQAGVKGTTNYHPCLLKPAQEAAMLTSWYGDTKAPEKQVGYIRYQFNLSQ